MKSMRKILDRKTQSFLVYLLIIVPIIITPLIADDFGGLFTPQNIVDSENSWIEQFGHAVNNINSGTHLNIIGQFLAKITYKIWIEISQSLGISFLYGFWVMKIIVHLLLLLTLMRLFWIFGYKSFIYNLNIIIVGYGLFAVNHGLWSNDPIVSYPLPGLFASTIALLAIISFIEFLEKSGIRSFLKFLILTCIAPLVYEINVSIFAFYFAYWILKKSVRKNWKNFVGTLVSILMSSLSLFLVTVLKNGNSAEYTGTQLATVDFFRFLRSLIYSISSLAPFKAWIEPISSNPIPLFISLIPLGLLVFRFIINVDFNFSKEGDQIGISRKKTAFLFLIWGISATAIQSLTVKIQIEASYFGFVYLFYSTLFVSVLIFCFFYLKEIQIHFNLRLILAVIISVNLIANCYSSLLLFREYLPSTNLINNVFNLQSTNQERCRLEKEWLISRTWPEYYKIETLESLDIYSQRIRKSDFCV